MGSKANNLYPHNIWPRGETEGRKMCDDRDRDWSNIPISQEMPEIANKPQKLKRVRAPLKHLDFGLQASITMRQYISLF